MFQIMVVEDDRSMARLLEALLTHAGYRVVLAEHGEKALEEMDRHHVDLIVMDIMMPHMDGYALTRLLRESGNNVPILMLTARQMQEDKKKGFLAGTDDYMTKPVDEEEFLLRVKALLRRAGIASSHQLKVDDVILDYDALSVERKGTVQTLPPKEFYLLYKLLSYPGRIFTRLELMDEIWGMESETVDTTVNVHINRLRKRFEGWTEFEIVSIRGIGYKAVIR